MKLLVLRPREYHPPGYTREQVRACGVHQVLSGGYATPNIYIITLINLDDATSAMLKKVLFLRINRVTYNFSKCGENEINQYLL